MKTNNEALRDVLPREIPEKPSLTECLQAASDTKQLLMQKDVLEAVPDLLREHYDARQAILIADENTFAAAGKTLQSVLEASGFPSTGVYVFPGVPRLHAEYRRVQTIEAYIKSRPDYRRSVPISVGAGTVNDLVKRAAGELGLPYLSVPTAASVDGYTSYGAALLADGFKQTFPCGAPRVLAADPELLRRAPAYLSSSGFGDLAGKIIAGTDWIIAAFAGALGAPGTEPIDPLAWAMTQRGLLDTLRQAVDAVRGDGGAVQSLFEGLAVTGFAMQYLKSSRPVSGCEHLWSHIWEMEDLSVDGAPVTHGHKVAMGALAAGAFTELLFASPIPPSPAPSWRRPTQAEREAEVRASFRGLGQAVTDAAVKTAEEKRLDASQGNALACALRDNWKTIRENVLEKLVPYDKLLELMRQGGCPCHPAEINLSRNRIIAAARQAQMIRNRYTVLDLAWDLGVFEAILAKLETHDRYI
ncbi:MAG: sn-glycerol-1-phosphate dehydrogenase [Treponema sp.]|jgi:glycerol-1-phosphate dehydrogenase [NAD(P)+]|nr:sn-glycerol-1-phosphate dehydrogenase [Treponema sp.]